MNMEKEKNLESFMEETLLGIWTVIQFSFLPIKSYSQIGALFENLIRTVLFCSLVAGGFWIYSFSHKQEYFFSGWNFLWLFIIGIFIFLVRYLYFLLDFKNLSLNQKITVEDLKNPKLNFSKIPSLMENPNLTPLGISLLSKKPVLLDIKSRVQHTIVSGATGQGKTTLLKTMLNHSLKHNHPIIIIDPKGEREDILDMKQKACFYGREKDFQLFSLSFPEESVSYNPLLNGTAQQIKARLMGGLRFEHEYYKAQADLFLGGILSAFQFLNESVSFSLLDSYLNDTSKINTLNEAIVTKEDSKLESRVDELTSILEQIQSIPKKDLAGLHAQISSINCLEFREILSGLDIKSNKTFSFEECLKNNKIAYFQMNVNGYGEISRQIGRMIVQDLKVLSSRIQSGQKQFSYGFCACFIDEFGSFVTWDFADFLKMARSSRIGIHLFCQGLSDLSQVSPDFKNQIIGNTASKILFRHDIGKDVEEWAGIAGTFSSQKKTYQITGAEEDEEMTGIGSIRDVKEMKIEFDVFKRLSPGQAILIDKAYHREDLFQVWRPAV